MDSARPDDESGPAAGNNRPGRPEHPNQHRGDHQNEANAVPDDLPPLPPEWGELVVPDDASALADEAQEIRAELRAERRRRRWERIFRTRRWERYGLSGPLLVLVLVVVASFASLLMTVLPTPPRAPKPAPLARPSISAGVPGGLLPDVTLPRGDGTPLAIRQLRPAVVLLIADSCNCQSLISSYVDATAEARMELLVIGEKRKPAVPELAMSRIVGLTDPKATLAHALVVHSLPGQPTSILVRGSGVIARVVLNATDPTVLRDDITALIPT
jgi:hypothetical protein